MPKSWNVLTLSCGEASIEDLCQKLPEGARNRLVDVEFGEQVPASLCGQLSEAVKEEYGTPIIEFLKQVASKGHEIQEAWREFKKQFSQMNGVSERVMARVFAIMFAGRLAYEIGVLPEDPIPVLSGFLELNLLRYSTKSENPKMIEAVRKYIIDNSGKFYSPKNQYCREIIGISVLGDRCGVGTQEEDSDETIEYILLGEPLKKYLSAIGFSIKEVLKAIKEERLLCDPDMGRGQKKRFMHPFLHKRVDGYPISSRILTYE